MAKALLRRFRGGLSNLKTTLLVYLCRRRFPEIMKRLRAKYARGERLRVYFVVTELAKWKCQAVYDRMRESAAFEPIIAVMMNDWACPARREFNKKVFLSCCSYFSSRGMAYKAFFDLEKEKLLPLADGQPDIVFFQQPWYSVKGSMPFDLDQIALTCYVPYFVANYVNTYYDCCRMQHRFYHRHFVLNEQLAKVYRETTAARAYVGEFVPVGHPSLDGIRFGGDAPSQGRRMVIYAPHWSLENCGTETPMHYATFAWSGRFLLEYAQRHPEIEWVFKPHPSLRNALIVSKLMSESEVESYYRSWGEVGVVSEVAGYEDIFNQSCALITDCGSFLTEYAITGKPIIHMLTPCSEAMVEKTPFAPLYSTYYRARNMSELQVALKLVVEDQKDPRCAERLASLQAQDLLGSCAAENIVRDFEKLLVP